MFRIFHKSANFGDKNQENVPRVWDTLRNNLGREIYLLQGRFKKWTTKHQNLKKGQPCKDEDAVTVPYHHLIRERKHSWKLNSVLCPNQVISLWYKHNRVKG